jgi:hypothetical protein
MTHDEEMEIPPDSPLLNFVVYLTRNGRRIAAVVPPDFEEAGLRRPPPEDRRN